MIHGLLWLPLLAVFIALAWAGALEYQKLEAYKIWAIDFERAKYDIYAALGQRGDNLTWGTPTRQGPIHLETLNFQDIQSVALTVAEQVVRPLSPPLSTDTSGQNNIKSSTFAQKGKIALRFVHKAGKVSQVPFTDYTIAEQWFEYLAPLLNR
jgi:hypothetical protein